MNFARPVPSCKARAARGKTTLCTILAALLAAPLPAADRGRNLADLSIEELMNEPITSVSKKEQRRGDAAAAISVLSNDDLRRSGATTVMEALRLVPGVNVGQLNSREWAVSARGFNGVYSNKLLVLVDGRAVYHPLFAGVYWDLQQVVLDDVDRVEVIRGPGATVWGANAVNGVINVVSRSARDTQGGLLYAGGGDHHTSLAGLRYGGQSGPQTYYRVFASHRTTADLPLANGTSARDAWAGTHGGFRLDHYSPADTQLTLQADATAVKLEADPSRAYTFNTLGRWTRRLSDRSSIEAQAYFDRTFRDELTRVESRTDTLDFSAQHTFAPGAGHNVIWGGGYRQIDLRLAPVTPLVQVRSARSRTDLFNVFLQDEFQVIPDRLTLTAGAKLEHNAYTGWEFQPSLRAAFKPTRESTLWAAVSRAVRTPDVIEGADALGFTTAAPFPGPGGLYVPTIVGNGSPVAEVLRAYEVGYRLQASRHLSLDVACFYNEYAHLIAIGGVRRLVPGTPVGIAEIPFANVQSAETYGGEASLTFAPVGTWRLTASYSRLVTHLHSASVIDVAGAPTSPRHQAVLRSSHDLTARTSLDVQWRHVSSFPGVAAYSTADFRLAHRCTDRLEISVVGQNLFEPQHPEQAPQLSAVTSEVSRSFHGRITWRF